MGRVALATVLLGAIALTAAAQEPVRVTGRVVADETGHPIANARVALTSPTTGSPVLTDGDGRFTLSALAARIAIAASKSGYGRREVADPATDKPIEIRLSRGAVIAGRVVDQSGDPVVSARVVAEAATSTPVRVGAVVASSFTDDRGDYRVGSLPAGAVVVSVTTFSMPVRQDMGGGRVMVTSSPIKTCYPGTTAPTDAQTLRLNPGDEPASIDFVVPSNPAGYTMTLISPLPSPPDTAPRKTGAIRGRVVSTDGRPVPRAEVWTLVGVASAPSPNMAATPGATVRFDPMSVKADDSGRFEFRDLPAGSFRVTARKTGYSAPGEAAAAFGPSPGIGIPVTLVEGEVHERADITLAPWGSINGRIIDELGEPLQGVSVQLLQVRYQAGRRRLVDTGTAPLTDDLGRYRIYGVAPGRYVVSASIGGVSTAELPGYTRSYFPGTPNASEAQFVSLVVSQERTGVDFSLARARTATISGTLLNAAGEPSTTGSVRLLPSARSTAVTSVSVGARLLRDGKFEFPNVTPGQYVMQVDRGRKNSMIEGEFGVLPVVIDGVDVTGLVLQTSAGSSITGRVTFDSYFGTRLPVRGAIELSPSPIDPDQAPMAPATAEIRDDWSFMMAGVNGPRRLTLRRVPAGWSLKEIRVTGIDATDRAIAFGRSDQSLADVAVVMTDRISTLSATVADDHTSPAPGAHLIVFPIDRDRWYSSSRYLRVAAIGADGTVAIAGLPSGSYYAAAVAALPADGDDAWQEPAYLDALARGASGFSLGEGGQQRLTLRLTAP